MPSKELLSSFRPPAFPGSYFLSFEGIEAAGKSQQIIAIKKFLEEKSFRVLILREAGGTAFGEKLRQAILSVKTSLHPLAEAYLFASSRAQLLDEVILKELNTPKTVIICDRFIDSSLAYQGNARGLGFKTILEIHNHFPLHLVPHMTFYLDISWETSQARQKKRMLSKDYFECQGNHFYRQVLEGYRQTAHLFPERIQIINGEKEANTVLREIEDKIGQLLVK